MTLPRWLGPGAVAFLLVWVLLLAAGRSRFLIDPGTFWHTATGELILKDGFVRTDPYTFTFAGHWWVPYQWLGEVGMALAHRAGGFDLQLLGAVTILAGTFAWLAVRLLRTGLNTILVGTVVALTLAAAGAHFHVRPHLFTLGAMAILIVLLAETDIARPKLARLFWLVPLCAVWTNVHGGVLGGVGTLGLVFAGWVIAWRLKANGPVKTWRDVRLLVLVLGGCVASLFASPYGSDMPKTWAVIMGASELREIIVEHRPLDATAGYAWPILALAALYLFTLYGVKRSSLRVVYFVPVVWFVLTVSRCRHASLFAVVALVAITAMWKHTRWALWMAARRPDLYQPGSAVARPRWAHLWPPVAAVALSAALMCAKVEVPLVGAGWARHDPQKWPLDALPALKAHKPKPGEPNALFNAEYVDGGFVIYHAPGYKVFVDDRCELFGGPWLLEFVRRCAEPGDAVERWQREYGRFAFALTRTGTPFDDWFRSSPEWELVAPGTTSNFYKRRAP